VFSHGLDAEVPAFNIETLLNVFLYPATVQAGANKKSLKVHKVEIFFGFDFEICIISLLVMSKY
jgi:hypothetical protein